MSLRGSLTFVLVLGCAISVSAQPEAPPPTTGAEVPPAAPADPQPPAAQPASPPADATPPAAPPSAQPPAAEPSGPAQPEPPPPVYGRLGGEPEPETEEGDWDPWEHAAAPDRRHEGFFLRLNVGVGLGMMSGKDHFTRGIDRVSLSGMGFATSLAVGGSIADNLILYGDLYQSTLFDPKVEADDVRVDDDPDALYATGVGDSARLTGVGLGVAYYFMPINLYASGSIGFGQMIFEDHRGDARGSDFGFATNLMVGKEWWVGHDWGLGLAGQFLFLLADDELLGSTRGTGLNLLFSATYN